MFRDILVNIIASLICTVLKSLFDMEPVYEVVVAIQTTLYKQGQKAVKAALRAAFTWFG